MNIKKYDIGTCVCVSVHFKVDSNRMKLCQSLLGQQRLHKYMYITYFYDVKPVKWDLTYFYHTSHFL